METANLPALRQRILAEYNRDGMMESLLGFGLLAGGANLLARGSTPATFAVVLIILIARAWKRRITIPRLGYAEIFSERSERRRNALVLAISAVGVLLLAAVGYMVANATFAGQLVFLQPHAKLVFGAAICAVIVAAGAVRRLPHLHAVAALLFLFIAVADWRQISAGYALGLAGMLLMLMGAVRLVLFLRANPRLDREAADERGR